MNKHHLQQILIKSVTAAVLVGVIFTSLLTPSIANAQGEAAIPPAGLPVTDIKRDAGQVVLDILGAVVRNALNAILGKLAYDTAVYIASGDKGQDSLIFNKSIEEYGAELADATVGAAIEGFADGAGLEAAGLCDPGNLFRIGLNVGLDLDNAKAPYTPACTLAELSSNWSELFDDPQFSDFVQLQFDPTANGIGIAMEADNIILDKVTKKANAALAERIANSGFQDKVETVSGYIMSPGSVIEDQLSQANVAAQRTFDTVGKPFTDALSIFSSTLVTQLMARLQDGVGNFADRGSLAGLIGGSGSVRGREAAQARYAELRKPKFSTTGTFNVIATLAACPADETERTIDNCVIGQRLAQAIIEGQTVREFADSLSNAQSYKIGAASLNAGEIVGDAGLTPRAITILKKYRILPVGWQIASDYITSPKTDQSPSLGQLLDEFDDCGFDDPNVQGDYSPYCGLINPDWVLKAPDNYCAREAPGPDLAVSVNSYDADLEENTQDVLQVFRLNYCADTRGCIAEDRSGNCLAYGYCTAERPIYRFEGLQCDPEVASCQTFEDSDGNTVSYTKSTLNYGNCAIDPGCQWYCTSKNEAGEYNCAAPGEVYDTCSADYADANSNVNFATQGQCACTVSSTCTVDAGTANGSDNDNGGIGDGAIDFQQCWIKDLDGDLGTNDALCDLGDSCGVDSPYYNGDGTCTCTYSDSCSVIEGQTVCTTADANVECRLNNEDGSGGADSCTPAYSSYSNAPVCQATGGTTFDFGGSCFVQSGNSQCPNSLGNLCSLSETCTELSASYNPDTNSCTCDFQDTSACRIPEGASFGVSDNGNTCVLGTQKVAPSVQQTSLFFDASVQSCDQNNAGCRRYIPMNQSTNLLANPYFDIMDFDEDTVGDAEADHFGFCSHDGNSCFVNSDCKIDLNANGSYEDDLDGDGFIDEANGVCLGWNQPNAQVRSLNENSGDALQPELGSQFVKLRANVDGVAGGMETIVNTGSALSDRTFTLAIRGASQQAASQSCAIQATIGDANGSYAKSDLVFVNPAGDIVENYTNEWDTYAAIITFPEESQYGGPISSDIKVVIPEDPNCEISIDGMQLSESSVVPQTIAPYAADVVHLNDNTVQCDPNDVGCELYTSVNDDISIPGIITNENADACLDANGNYDYGNIQCNQCNGNPELDQPDDYFVGCSFFQEVPLTATSPVNTEEVFTVIGSVERTAAAKRGGGRCSLNNDISCFTDADCADTNPVLSVDAGTCVNQISLIPSTAEQCTPEAVGCEEYTNLDSIAQGGEGVEYYSSLKQCVKTDDEDIATYTTFEGSDNGGVSINEYVLKVDTTFNAGAPCTRLNPLSEDFNADCAELPHPNGAAGVSINDCGPEGDDVYGEDPDCRQFVNQGGDVFYRYESKVVEASEECIPLRNSLDERVYYAITDSSTSCSVEYLGCREYKGTDSGNQRVIFNEDFRSNSTENWEADITLTTSNESTLSGDFSLQFFEPGSNGLTIRRRLTEVRPDGSERQLLRAGRSYELSFWMKHEGGANPGITPLLIAGGQQFAFNYGDKDFQDIPYELKSAGEWHEYTFNPLVLPDTLNLQGFESILELTFSGTEAYIDNIVLRESTSQYLIQNSYDYCQNFEGCKEYVDRSGQTHYLKSFERLCDENVVGCAVFIDTFNSASPYAESYNLNNEYVQDDVVVPADNAVTLVFDEDNLCNGTAYGCTEVGLPDVDERTGEIQGYTKQYLLNRPDDYVRILCAQSELACEAYTSASDGTAYFKDPGSRTCELRTYVNDSGNTIKGWFKNGSPAEKPDCPLVDPTSSLSQPLGGVCNSNSISPQEDKIGLQCNTDANCYPAGWSVGDPQPRCISDISEDVDVRNNTYLNYEFYPSDGRTLEAKDFGWVGTCPEEDSGCTEYIDPYSPNILELNSNPSFEDDARDRADLPYLASQERDGFPDFWRFPDNAGGSGFDIELDASIDVPSGCANSDNVMQTGSDAYNGRFVSPYTGGSALMLTNCALRNKSRRQDIQIDRDALYTIRAQVKVPDQAAAENAEFSIGLMYYYQADGQEDQPIAPEYRQQAYVVADRATIGGASWEEDPEDGNSVWYQWQGNIGFGSNVQMPKGANVAKVFIVNHSTTPIYFDDVSIKENDRYYYIDYTVDGTTEKFQADGTNSCFSQDSNRSEVTSDGACVAFRDTTFDAQKNSQSGVDCTPCLLTPNSDTCRNIIDACDTNTILKVKRDRVCSEWLACEEENQAVGDDNTIISQCEEIITCTSLDENGDCRDSVEKLELGQLSSISDEHVVAVPGDSGQLDLIQNRTGYSKIGFSWAFDLRCDGGANSGQVCTTSNDCNTATDQGNACVPYVQTEGYYPYGWIAESGTSGIRDNNDLIEYKDFEDLYCAGSLGDPTQACVSNGVGDNAGQCYTRNLRTRQETNIAIAGDDAASLDSVVYLEAADGEHGESFNVAEDRGLAFCPNSPNFGPYRYYGTDKFPGSYWDTCVGDDCVKSYPNFWPFGAPGPEGYTETGWQSLGGSEVFVTQYDNSVDLPKCNTEGCPRVDVNNVLEFSGGDDEPFAAGVEYDLQDTIVPDGEYSLSLDARFVPGQYVKVEEGVDNPSAVTICLQHAFIRDANGVDLERSDCFVNGFGAADVVFLVDASGSMGAEIGKVRQALPSLAQQLGSGSGGVDVRFAIVEMGYSSQAFVRQDLTKDIGALSSALDDIQRDLHGAKVSTYGALLNAINNRYVTGNYDDAGARFVCGLASLFAGLTVGDCIYDSQGRWGVAAGTETNVSLRPDATQIIVLVTDTYNEVGNATQNDVVEALAGTDKAVMVISQEEYDDLKADAGDADVCVRDLVTGVILYCDYNPEYIYGRIASVSGGAVSRQINDADWSVGSPSILEQTVEVIVNAADDVFQFDEELKSYTFGPIKAVDRSTTTGGANAAESGNVITRLTITTSDGAAAQIDNVSLLPVLEVSKDIPPIARSCRAYPENNSLACDYTTANGFQYRGWKGYCLEKDPIKPNRCITWFPLDVLAGEPSVIPGTTSDYNARGGRSEVYYCAVSKGSEVIGYCDNGSFSFGNNAVCIPNASSASGMCPTGQACVQGQDFLLEQANQNDRSFDVNNTAITVRINNSTGFPEPVNTTAGAHSLMSDGTVNAVANAYTTQVMEWDVPDVAVFGTDDTFAANEIFDGRGVIVKIPANEVLRNTHISEMRSLLFNTGSQGNGNGGGFGGIDPPYEFQYWGQMGALHGAQTVDLSAGVDRAFGGSNSKYDDFRDYNAESDAEGLLSSCAFPNDCDDYGNWDLLDYVGGSIAQDIPGGPTGLDNLDANYMPWLNCGAFMDTGPGIDEGEINWHSEGIGCRVWGLYDSDFTRKWYAENIDNPDANPNGMDMVYTWVWSNFRDEEGGLSRPAGDAGSSPGFHECILGAGSVGNGGDSLGMVMDALMADPKSWFASPCIEPNIKALMTGGQSVAPDSADLADVRKVSENQFNRIVGGDEASRAGGIGTSADKRNPWKQLNEACPGMRTQSQGEVPGEFFDTTSEQTQICTFDRDDLNDWEGWYSSGTADESPHYDREYNGGNVFSLYVDVNDKGYVQAVYTMVYLGAEGTIDDGAALPEFLEQILEEVEDEVQQVGESVNLPAAYAQILEAFGVTDSGADLTSKNNMSLTLQTDEACLLVGEAVGPSGRNKAWAYRTTENDGFSVRTGGTDTIRSTESLPFGSITPQSGDPAQWDTIQDNPAQLASLGTQPVFAGDYSINSGAPYGCLGNCGAQYCVGNITTIGQTCTSDSSCGDNGKCVGLNQPQMSRNTRTGANSRLEQIETATEWSRNRLKYIFADVGRFWIFTPDTSQGIGYNNKRTSTTPSDTASIEAILGAAPSTLDFFGTTFEDMQPCNSDGSARPLPGAAEDEYCGVYPVVNNIQVNGREQYDAPGLTIDASSYITLTFDAVIDENQKDGQNVTIEWWPGEVTNQSMNNPGGQPQRVRKLMQCPTNLRSNGVCRFRPKITVSDNWGWCSGRRTLPGADHRILDLSANPNLQEECGTYDEVPFDIIVRP